MTVALSPDAVGVRSTSRFADVMVRSPSTRVRTSWRDDYLRSAGWADAVLLCAIGALATWAAFATSQRLGERDTDRPIYAVTTAVILISWLAVLRIIGVYDRKVVGEGGEEYRRVARSVVVTFAGASLVSTLGTFSLSRTYLALLFGLGLAGLCTVRALLRDRLRTQRSTGESISRVLVVGGHRSATNLARSFRAHPRDGYVVVATWAPLSTHSSMLLRDAADGALVAFDGSSSLDEVLAATAADTVVVTDTELLGDEGLKALGWALHGSGIDLLVSPNVLDVAGPRIHVRPVANLPLIHLDEPRYEGAAKARKAALDRVLAATALILTAPALLAIAAAVKVTSSGPVLYRSTRVGIGGTTFQMLKFRTMVDGADRRVSELASANMAAGPLFKIKDDPRVTRLGAVLRRYSLDELPQLLNVLKGDMSIVGPRPSLPAEALAYEMGVERRLLVKQGMTGLWQVSGRSDLAWEDAVRLDLDYVENWSMTRDLQIIWRTIGAVIRPSGAY